jgi:alkylhydroperoxidase family enzyme
VGPADLDRLRAFGFDDTAIHDATQVIAYFNYITRIADGLGVEPESFVRRWGQPPA